LHPPSSPHDNPALFTTLSLLFCGVQPQALPPPIINNINININNKGSKTKSEKFNYGAFFFVSWNWELDFFGAFWVGFWWVWV